MCSPIELNVVPEPSTQWAKLDYILQLDANTNDVANFPLVLDAVRCARRARGRGHKDRIEGNLVSYR
jgi:hypothetical protein